MQLVAILVVPALAAGFSLLPIGRRLAAPVTLLAAAIVLGLALAVAAAAGRTGRIEGSGEWLTCDGFGALILLLVAFVGFTAALFSWGYVAERGRRGGHASVQRYYVLYNLFLLALLSIPLLANVALVWIAVELTTLLSAFLVAFEDTPEALEAAWKYVVLTTLGTVLALLGFLILYWGSSVAGSQPFTWSGLFAAAPHMPPTLLWAAFLFILIGFGTKVGIVPMHTWLPDAYSQAPASFCALLSGVESTTVLYVILRVFSVVGGAPELHARPWFIGFGLLSVAVATLLFIDVRDFKRMFAYSTVEHMGIILVAAGLGGADANLGAAYQMTGHAIAKSFCFFAAGVTALGVGTQEIASIRGLVRTSPVAAIALLAAGFAIAGAPPFALFVSEFVILRAGLASGRYLVIGLLAFLVVVAFCAVMLHVNRMVFGAADHEVAASPLPRSCKLTLALAAIPLVLIGIYVPSPLYDLLKAAANAMGG